MLPVALACECFGDLIAFRIKPPPKFFATAISGYIEELVVTMAGWVMLPFGHFCFVLNWKCFWLLRPVDFVVILYCILDELIRCRYRGCIYKYTAPTWWWVMLQWPKERLALSCPSMLGRMYLSHRALVTCLKWWHLSKLLVLLDFLHVTKNQKRQKNHDETQQSIKSRLSLNLLLQ